MVRTYIFKIDPLTRLNPTSLCAMTYGIQCKTKRSWEFSFICCWICWAKYWLFSECTLLVLRIFVHFTFSVIFLNCTRQFSALHTFFREKAMFSSKKVKLGYTTQFSTALFFCETTKFISRLSSFNNFSEIMNFAEAD